MTSHEIFGNELRETESVVIILQSSLVYIMKFKMKPRRFHGISTLLQQSVKITFFDKNVCQN